MNDQHQPSKVEQDELPPKEGINDLMHNIQGEILHALESINARLDVGAYAHEAESDARGRVARDMQPMHNLIYHEPAKIFKWLAFVIFGSLGIFYLMSACFPDINKSVSAGIVTASIIIGSFGFATGLIAVFFLRSKQELDTSSDMMKNLVELAKLLKKDS
jgi:hypothetical protein